MKTLTNFSYVLLFITVLIFELLVGIFSEFSELEILKKSTLFLVVEILT